jgi:CRP/FNR family transcriptional regulator
VPTINDSHADAVANSEAPRRRGGHGLFHRLRQTPATPIRRAASTVTFEPQEIIYREGEWADSLYVVRRGRVKLISHLMTGRPRILRLHARGALVGLAGLDHGQHRHTAQAIDAVSAWRIPSTVLRETAAAEPALYAAVLADCLRELATADTWICEFATGSIRSRLARLVRYLATLEEPEPGDRELTLLTSEEMAEILGVTPESVSRVVAEFKREGVLTPIEGSDPLHSVLIEDIGRLSREAAS